MSNFEELGFKVGPSFIGGYKRLFQTPIQDDGFTRLETSVTIGVGNGRFWPKQKDQFETKLLKVRRTSRPKLFFTLASLWTGVFERVWPPHQKPILTLSFNDGFRSFHKII